MFLVGAEDNHEEALQGNTVYLLSSKPFTEILYNNLTRFINYYQKE
jgi:hypothetical protein